MRTFNIRALGSGLITERKGKGESVCVESVAGNKTKGNAKTSPAGNLN